MGQPTQRATNYTARSNIEPARIFLHANGQSAPRSGGSRDVGRGAGSHTPSTASESFAHHISHTHTARSGIDEKRPTEKFVWGGVAGRGGRKRVTQRMRCVGEIHSNVKIHTIYIDVHLSICTSIYKFVYIYLSI